MFSATDTEGMRLALAEARKAREAGEMPVGAAVMRGGEVIAACGNSRERDHDPAGHAEINALRLAARKLGDWRLSGCTLYVTLEPCPMCAGAAAQARVERVVFGAYDAQAGCCGSIYRIPEDPAFPWYAPCDGGCLREECEALWDGAFADQRSEQT